MFEDRLISVLSVLCVSIMAASLIIAVLWRAFRPVVVLQARTVPQPDEAETVFLFEGNHLTDATPGARHWLTRLRVDQADLNVITAHLSRRFPDIRDKIAALRRGRDHRSSLSMAGSNDGESIRIDSGHGLLRLTLSGAGHRTVDKELAESQTTAMQQELLTLRSIAEDAPQLIWQQDTDDCVIWANRAYLALADRLSPPEPDADPIWPSRPYFADLKPSAEDGTSVTQRVPIMFPSVTEPQWFEVTSVRRGPTTVHFAIDANNIIQAESGRQKFIQTLTKTFAHLSIGLAIFDRDRRLVLFNPAFLDLTGLPVGFLSARPLVHSVLDRLRDMNMLPEPKNYTSWRDQVTALEAAAVQGTYCETWSLPSGQTYRVTGRPHPDGAIAFLFEDISDEILLTRHFRSELETAQAVLDSLDEGIAVFSKGGTLVMCNAIYASTWGHLAIGLTDINILDEVVLWKTRAAQSPIWDRLVGAVEVAGERVRFHDIVRLDDGLTLTCRFAPLPGGSMLIGFRPHQIDEVQLTTPRAVRDQDIEPNRPQTRPRVVAGV